MASIYLQSFFSKPLGFPISVARWQPNKYNYKTFRKLTPVRLDGSAIRNLPPNRYMEEYCKVLRDNFNDIKDFFDNIYENSREVSLLCWCNRERQGGYTKLFCHTILIGYFIEIIRPEITVHYLDGREDPVWERGDFTVMMKSFINNIGKGGEGY